MLIERQLIRSIRVRRNRQGDQVTMTDDVKPRPLPSGPLTFLFTDVVDSTALWERAPSLMDSALRRHDELIELSVDSHGGILLKHRGEGDSTFCVFRRAAAAIAAATDAQRRLANEAWDEAIPIRVRMGIHSGESIQRGRDYYGRTVNRAARIRAVAKGGQVLLSSPSAELAGKDLPEDTELRFLRREVLRGIDRAESIHELVDLSRSREEAPSLAKSSRIPQQREIDAAVNRSFGGRDDVMSMIEALCSRVAPDGRQQLILLEGEPGIGKTAIACAAAQAAHRAGWSTLFGECHEHVTAPFQPFRAILNHLVETVPMGVLAAHITEHGGEIGRLTSQLTERVGALPPVDAFDPETTRQLLIEAIADLVLRSSEDRPMVIVVDAVQWADRSTLLVIDRLVRSGPHPLVIIGTNRSSEESSEAAELLDEVREMELTTVVDVQPFDEDAVLAVLERASGGPLSDEGRLLARHLVDKTGGNALFATELTRYYTTVGFARIDDRGVWHFDAPPPDAHGPQSISSVVQRRLGRLDKETQQILGAAAVVGRSFESDVLAVVLDTDEASLLDALEEAADASLIRELAVDTFEFTSGLVRQAVSDGLSESRRGLLHRSIALALEEGGRDASPAAIARHWSSSGRDNRAEVTSWAHRAGTSALADLSPEMAVGWFRTALDAASDDATRLGILIDLGDAQLWAEAEAGRRTLFDAAALAERLGDDEALIRAALANNRGGASRAGTVDTQRVAVLEQSLAVCADDSADRARLLATLAIELSQGPDLERRIAVSDEAVAIARGLGDDFTLVRVLLLTVEANRIPATLQQRIVDTEELLTLALQVGDPAVIGVAALRSLRVKFESGAFTDAGDVIEILDKYARFDPYVLYAFASTRAALAHAMGDLDGAVALADDALDSGRSQNDSEAVHLTTIAMIKRERGELGDLLHAIEYIVQNYPGIAGFRPLLGCTYVQLGRHGEAADLLQHEIDTDLGDYPMNPLWMASVSMVALLAIDLRHAEAAEMLYPVLDPWRGRTATSVVSYNGFVTELLGRLALTMNDLDRAASDLDDAIAQAEQSRALVSLTYSRLGRAQVDAARGLDQLAHDRAVVVEVEARRLGMSVAEEAAQDIVARCGPAG
jgi:class 3 adenylate cyclase